MKLYGLYLVFVFALISIPCIGFGMQSSSYKINSDVINNGGGLSGSTNYNLGDTLGEQATGRSGSSNYQLNAGFWQMQADSYIAISSPADVSLASINGLTGGTTTGSVGWNVITDNDAGYSLFIKASSSPALASSNDSFADYAATSTNPDYTFSVSSSASAFGYTPEGSDIAQAFKDNGSVCATGSSDTLDHCWSGLSTSNALISQGGSSNQPGGATTTVKFRASSGSAHIQTAGTYTATITVTALTL